MKNKYTFDSLFNADRVDMMRTVMTIENVELMANCEEMVEEDIEEKREAMVEDEVNEILLENATK